MMSSAVKLLRTIYVVAVPAIIFILPQFGYAKDTWPQKIKSKSGVIVTLYEPQPESFSGNKLIARTAISVQETATSDLLFGVVWVNTTVGVDRDNRLVSLQTVSVTSIRLPDMKDTVKIRSVRKLIETEVPKMGLHISLDQLLTALANERQKTDDVELKNNPPKIIYTTTPSLLILIDGEPRLQQDEKLEMEKVVNTPFLIIHYDKKYYLYADNWYESDKLLSGYKYTSYLPNKIDELNKQIKQQNQSAQKETQTKLAIVISTEPAELIQTTGAANFASVKGTSLLYASNSDNDIFMDVNSQSYYILLSGRWYASKSLTSDWVYVQSDNLPAEFKKIPEGSEKDRVLASIAGTDAAKEAVMDAQVPQTTKVDRKTATCTVTYNGEPKFEAIEGTNLQVAVNTTSTVIESEKKYYCVENGVWYIAQNTTGPWTVSTERPKDIDKIPASSRAYNVKYVYIYDVTPDVVYVGYTPGYMGCYVYGPTIVYGTGFYYNPWFGPYYYPRPVTYGFSMNYNPFTGWSFGFHISYGCFTFSTFRGGWWGPPVYHPPFHPPYSHYYGPHAPVVINNNINIHNNYINNNNIYNHHGDNTFNQNISGQTRKEVPHQNNNLSGQTKNTTEGKNLSGATRNGFNSPGTKNNVYGDKTGNVYQKQGNGNWQQRNNNTWQPAQSNQQLDQQHTARDRGYQRTNNFNQSRGSGGGGFRRR
jgi:hypothetical protein